MVEAPYFVGNRPSLCGLGGLMLQNKVFGRQNPRNPVLCGGARRVLEQNA